MVDEDQQDQFITCRQDNLATDEREKLRLLAYSAGVLKILVDALRIKWLALSDFDRIL